MADAHMNVLDPRRSPAQPFGRMLWTGAVIEVRRIHTLAPPHQCHSVTHITGYDGAGRSGPLQLCRERLSDQVRVRGGWYPQS